MKIILLTGRPGTGKTWVMQQLIRNYECTKEGKKGLINYLEGRSVIITGKYSGAIFDGSDALSMAAISSVGDLIDSADCSAIVFEGDRFTNNTMLGHDPVIINIKGNGDEGRGARGSSQTPQRLKAMATRYDSYSYNFRVEDSNEALTLVKQIISGAKDTKSIPLLNGNGQEELF